VPAGTAIESGFGLKQITKRLAIKHTASQIGTPFWQATSEKFYGRPAASTEKAFD
jgi:hypothetical protein